MSAAHADPLAARRLGATGLEVTRIGLGLAALGRPAYITLGRDHDLGHARSVADLEARCHDMLDAAWDAGIRYVDAARSYGLAEAFLASWLHEHSERGADLTVGSKWGYAYVGDWQMATSVHERKDLTVATLRRQIGETRALLGAHLRLYHIHSATVESGVLDDVEVLRELARLRESGLTIGLSVSGPRQADAVRRALDVRLDGVNPFQTVQATWNLLETSAGEALADASRSGWGVIIKEAVANGRLTDRYADALPHALRDFVRAQGATVDAVAIAAALANPWADLVLSGAVTRAQLASNLEALELAGRARGWPAVNEPASQYWTARGALPWQ